MDPQDRPERAERELPRGQDADELEREEARDASAVLVGHARLEHVVREAGGDRRGESRGVGGREREERLRRQGEDHDPDAARDGRAHVRSSDPRGAAEPHDRERSGDRPEPGGREQQREPARAAGGRVAGHRGQQRGERTAHGDRARGEDEEPGRGAVAAQVAHALADAPQHRVRRDGDRRARGHRHERADDREEARGVHEEQPRGAERQVEETGDERSDDRRGVECGGL